MSEEEDLYRSVAVLDRAKESRRWAKIYALSMIAYLVIFCGFMTLIETVFPAPSEPTIGVLNGMITALAIVYSMTVFSISRPSVLMPSLKLDILYLDTFFMSMAAFSLYLVSMGFVSQSAITTVARVILVCFYMGLYNFVFLLDCATKYMEKAEGVKIGKAWQRISVEYEKRKKQEEEGVES